MPNFQFFPRKQKSSEMVQKFHFRNRRPPFHQKNVKIFEKKSLQDREKAKFSNFPEKTKIIRKRLKVTFSESQTPVSSEKCQNLREKVVKRSRKCQIFKFSRENKNCPKKPKSYVFGIADPHFIRKMSKFLRKSRYKIAKKPNFQIFPKKQKSSEKA